MERRFRALPFALFCFALFVFLLPRLAFAGPVFAPGSKLFVARTAHFDIIFPEKSRTSALRLAAMADSVYDEVAGKLHAKRVARIPVAITPDIGSFNGYTNPFPYMHIVLYDTSLDPGWTSFADNFRGLFLHELTHAVSMQIRAPWADFLSGVFGSWVLPGLLDTPEFMAEGVAVSFESADGATGRANDPLIKERVRQDIRENRFKSPVEASGLYDEYPYSTVFYEYGGLFNAYIQKAYGMEKYAELWKAMGALMLPGSLDPYEVGFYEAFRKTYGRAFLSAWADFRDSLALSGLVEAPEVLDPGGISWLYGGLAGDDETLYWIDLRSGRAMAMDLATGRRSKLFDAGADSICDVSRDGKTLLVSRALSLSDGRDRVETLAYDLGKKRFEPSTSVAGMREARFFRDGWVGIVSRLHETDLVLASSGGSRTLLRGSETLMFSSPAVIDEARVALIVAVAGIRRIGILDVASGELSLIKPAGEDAELFAYARQLSASGGAIYFNYDSDDRFYKLGRIELLAGGGGEIRLETADFSGGVHWPRAADGRVYYVGRFSEGDRICRYPLETASGARTVAFSMEAFGPEAPPARPPVPAAAEASPAVLPYRPLAYANPFNMWFLYPDLQRIGRSFRVFGLFVFQDPIDANGVNLTLGYDAGYPFADASLSWTSRELPVSFAATLGDSLAYGAAGAPKRQSSLSLSAALRLPAYPSGRAAVLGLGGSLLGRAEGESGSPYGWGYSSWNETASASLGWEGLAGGASPGSARGFEIASFHDLDLASLMYKTEAHLALLVPSPSLRLDCWGAWASSPLLALDSSSPVFPADRRPAYFEYESSRTGRASLLAEGAISWRLADQGVHANILGLYFNRLYLDLGVRGAYFRDEALGSAFARASLDVGAAAGMAAAALRVFGEGFARLSEADPAKAFGWRLGIQTSTEDLP